MSKKSTQQQQSAPSVPAVPPVPESSPVTQEPAKEGTVVLSMAEEAKAEFSSILAFEQSRMERWARVVRVHCVVPEDWTKYESLVKGAAVEYLAKQFGFKVDTPRASWPEAAVDQYKGRFAPMFSNMGRIGKGLLAYKKEQVISILEDKTKSYNAKLSEFPRDSRGRKAGTVITPSATMTEGKEGEAKDESTKASDKGKSSPKSIADTQLSAKIEGFTAVTKAIASMDDAYIYGMLQAVAKKLDSQLAPEWVNLSKHIKEACTAHSKRKVEEAKAKDRVSKPITIDPPEVEVTTLEEAMPAVVNA